MWAMWVLKENGSLRALLKSYPCMNLCFSGLWKPEGSDSGPVPRATACGDCKPSAFWGWWKQRARSDQLANKYHHWEQVCVDTVWDVLGFVLSKAACSGFKAQVRPAVLFVAFRHRSLRRQAQSRGRRKQIWHSKPSERWSWKRAWVRLNSYQRTRRN